MARRHESLIEFGSIPGLVQVGKKGEVIYVKPDREQTSSHPLHRLSRLNRTYSAIAKPVLERAREVFTNHISTLDDSHIIIREALKVEHTK